MGGGNMNNLGQTFIYIWAVAMFVIFISGIVFVINLIKKKDHKIAKRVFISAIIVAISSFVLYGITSPVIRCKHEYTTILDQPASCTEDGKKEQYCPLCDFTKKEIYKATGHKMLTKSKTEPTYDSEGKQINVCSICGYEVITKIDKLIKETKNQETTKRITYKETTTKNSSPKNSETTTKIKSDTEIANEISNDIANIGKVTLDKEQEILKLKERYDQLTKKQKKRVKNYEILENYLADLETLHELEQLNNNPTYSLTKDDIVGIWKERYPNDTHTAYYYFANNGYIYYISSEDTPKQSSFTSEYCISNFYEFDKFDKNNGTKNGSFYCSPSNDTFDFAVQRDDIGNMSMVISRNGSTRGTGQGTYIKTKISINNNSSIISNSKHTCEVCNKEGTHKYNSFTGQTEYYCTKHYEELKSMLNSFGLN